MGLVDALLDLLFPPKCPFCGTLLERGELFCTHCQESLPWLEGSEAEQKPEFLALCVSALRYQEQVRSSIHRYKFGAVSSYAPCYGLLVSQCVRDHLAGRYDLISWPPLSDKRRRERGYDQARLLAEHTAKCLGAKAVSTLRKVRDTPAQSSLQGAEARRANILGAYTCPVPELVRGKRILLIDDVVTTGATLSECARVLRTAGAAEVVCATLARAR